MNDTFFKKLFGIHKREITSSVILTPFLPLQIFKGFLPDLKTAPSLVYKTASSGTITILSTGMGATLVGDAVLFLENSPCRNICFLGSCGGVSEDSQIGDLLVPDKACCGEGFSEYFSGKDIAIETKGFTCPSKNISNNFIELLNKKNVSFKTGSIFTTGSLFSETAEFIDKLKVAGFTAIDLELSAFFTASKIAKLNSFACMYITDIPNHKPFYDKISGEDRVKISQARDTSIKTIIEFLINS